MRSFVLQDWITIRGSTATPITQGESEWLDLAAYQDVSFWLDIREFSGASAPTIAFQTAPIKDEVLFQPMLALIPLTLTPSNPYRVPITIATNPSCPVARYIRWQLVGPGSAWDVTFRVLVSADALGL